MEPLHPSRYYRSVLRRGWAETLRRIFGSHSDQIVTAILTTILIIILFWIVEAPPEISEHIWSTIIPIIAAVTVFVGIFALDIFKAFYLLANEDKEEIEKLNRDLEGTKTPRLEFVLGDGPPFIERYPFDTIPPYIERYAHIGLSNLTATTIEDISVVLERIEPSTNVPMPLVLRQMDDNPTEDAPYQKTFNLNPGEIKYLSILSRRDSIDSKTSIRIYTAQDNLYRGIPSREYVLSIRATGRNVPAIQKRFLLTSDNSGALIFKLLQ